MSKATKIITALIILILVAWSIFGNSKTDTIKIGVSTLLSGDFAALGENIVNASKLAVEEINKNGGVNGQELELIVEDAGCESKTGLNAVTKLVTVDHAHYIVGGMCSNGTLAAAPIANEHKAIIITPVTGGKNIDEAGEYIFRNANSDILAGRDIANAMIDLGYKNVAVVTAITEYTVDIKKTFEQTTAQKGGTVSISEEFTPNTSDYRTLISKIKAKNPQAILVLSQLGTDAANFIKQSKELGLNKPFFSDFTFATNADAKKIVGNFDGIYFADPAYDAEKVATKAFFELYKKTYNKDSLIPFHAAASYDAIMMYAKALKSEGDNSEKVKDWLLTNVKNYDGLMGTYSFDEKGNSNLGFEIKVFKNGIPVKIE